MPKANVFCGATEFNFLVSDGVNVSCFNKFGELWKKGNLNNDKAIYAEYNSSTKEYVILGEKAIYTVSNNSHRKDIEFVEKNFWGQTTTEVLPPDERPELKHNRSLFKLDAGDRHSELSAGDTFLLPYWMGRFLGVISAPQK
jgi:hypothetical protein